MRLVGNDKLKIVLSPQDMQELSITFEALDYANDQTKALILGLLTSAKLSTGFDPTDRKLLIEAYPEPAGGCTIYITALKKPPGAGGTAHKNEITDPAVFGFRDVDILIQATTKLFSQFCQRIYKSSLYRMNGEYRLIIYPLDRVDSLTVSFLSEYGRLIGNGYLLASYIEEHGDPIIEGNAIDVLSHYLS